MDNQPFQKSSQSQGTEASPCPALMPLPDSDAYGDLPQFPKGGVLPFRRTIRRQELRQIVPLAETTIYEMERRGEFPRRFNLTPRCVVWDLEEVHAWIEARKQASRFASTNRSTGPDVRQRKTRPVKNSS
ncbi:helix-turn-helix transcriptional regulator [Pollutimonas bauzanensis]|uniref:Transcriptional regulator, AlpA family n=1 Tax=Pollutimonas bauzanensis TaxID=658167 RepID=A0A1M5YDY7_9BURK|nr:transcriptional regulator, AlpA family [Pollutimonas bauzanensis]